LVPESVAAPANNVAPEDRGRAILYSFLAKVLYAAPKQDITETANYFASDDSDLGRAFNDFLSAFRESDQDVLGREYHDLFIGVGRGELLPFGSYYLTGFLNEKPLADLRADLNELGFERAMGVSEPEDHIATLCDVMGQLVIGSGEGEFTLYDQDKFFAAHLKPWAGKFFADLQSAKKADLYRTIGRIGQVFMAIEEDGFSMIARA
jgi:TorA maturation chaperone TorD